MRSIHEGAILVRKGSLVSMSWMTIRIFLPKYRSIRSRRGAARITGTIMKFQDIARGGLKVVFTAS